MQQKRAAWYSRQTKEIDELWRQICKSEELQFLGTSVVANVSSQNLATGYAFYRFRVR